MGFQAHTDGYCKVCGSHSQICCDHCELYICEDHRVLVPIQQSIKDFVFCKDCPDKGPLKPYRQQKVARWF